jgi:hypothetical protein
MGEIPLALERDVMAKALAALLVALALATPGPARGDDEDKDKPGLHLRATPRFAFSPATILFTAELKGGDDIEELYCPEVEWEWGDGGKSVSEGDCDPWEPGTKIERRYTGRHEYRRAGRYRIRVTLSHVGKAILSQSMTIDVRPGVGDPTMQY